LGPTQSPIKLRAHSSRLNPPERDAEHSPPSRERVVVGGMIAYAVRSVGESVAVVCGMIAYDMRSRTELVAVCGMIAYDMSSVGACCSCL
jgi:hypothetical protein